DFDLQQTVLKGGMVVVTATKTKHLLKDVPVAVSVITRREIETGNFSTVQQALRYLSGVQVNESYGWGDKGKIEFEGMEARHTLILVNGQRVYGGHRNAVDVQAYPLGAVERIEVVKGPGSCLYGSDAMGGVVHIITRSASKKPTFFLAPSFGTRGRKIYEANNGLSIGKLSYFLNFTHRQSDGISPETDKYKEDAVQGNFGYKINHNSKLALMPYYSMQKMNCDDRKQTRYSLNSIWQWQPDKASTLKMRGSFFHYNHCWTTPNRISGENKRTGYKNNSYEMELNYTRHLGNRHLLTLGYYFDISKMNNDHIGFAADEKTNSVYIQDEITLNTVTLLLGTRADRHNRWGTEINPKVSFLYKISGDLKIRGSVGKAFRGPSLIKLYGDNWRMGPYLAHKNPDLKPESSIGYQLGAEWNILADVLGGVSFFRNDLENLVSSQYVKSGRPPWDLYWSNMNQALTQGIELNLASLITNHISARLGYTYLNTEDKKTGKQLTYKSGEKLFFEFVWQIPRIGLGINVDGRYIGKRYKDKENLNPLSEYALANISLTKNFTRVIQLYLRVDNIFNKKEVEDAYTIDGTELLGGLRLSYQRK
ncbi:MAG TPA: TonB-dependent receptor, partial [Nitrospirae bacterium]|nr:TonB-dependent receptor [Nitrospirota bacterium]